MEGTEEQPAGPANAMETNEDAEHDEQPEDPMHNEGASVAGMKEASAQANFEVLAKLANKGKLLKFISEGAGKAPGKSSKLDGSKLKALMKKGPKASSDVNDYKGGKSIPYGAVRIADLMKNSSALGKLASARLNESQMEMLKAAHADGVEFITIEQLNKLAEDALNPANISAAPAAAQGAEAPVGASGSEDGPAPDEPADVDSQKGMVASNEAAINYTKRDAKADPKRDLGHLLVSLLSQLHTTRLWSGPSITRMRPVRRLLQRSSPRLQQQSSPSEAR